MDPTLMEKMGMEGAYSYSSYEKTYDYDGLENKTKVPKKKGASEWETKAKLAEAALAQIVNHIGTARECKKIADDALTILNRR